MFKGHHSLKSLDRRNLGLRKGGNMCILHLTEVLNSALPLYLYRMYVQLCLFVISLVMTRLNDL